MRLGAALVMVQSAKGAAVGAELVSPLLRKTADGQCVPLGAGAGGCRSLKLEALGFLGAGVVIGQRGVNLMVGGRELGGAVPGTLVGTCIDCV